MSNLNDDLKAYHAAVESEYAVKSNLSDEIRNAAEDKLVDLLPDAQATAEHLLKFAESESVRWNVAKYIFDNALGKVLGTSESDMEKLVRSLQATPSKK